jgi:hypothetical protein
MGFDKCKYNFDPAESLCKGYLIQYMLHGCQQPLSLIASHLQKKLEYLPILASSPEDDESSLIRIIART